MAKVQYGIPAGATAQGLSNPQIAQLMLQMQLQRGQDPSQTPGYDSLGDYGQQPNHPVYSVGQGLADVAGQLGSAYFRKKRDQQLMQGMAENNANLNMAAGLARDTGLTQRGVDVMNGNPRMAQLAFPNGAPQQSGAGGPATGPMQQAQPAFPDRTAGEGYNDPMNATQRGNFALDRLSAANPNGSLALQYGDKIREAAQAAQPPLPSVLPVLKPGETLPGRDANGKITTLATGGPAMPETAVGKAKLDHDAGRISDDEYKTIVAKETGADPLTKAHLDEAQSSAALSKSRLEQLKQGQLDDDAIEFRGHLAAAGDPSAYQGIPKSIYGSVSIAKIGNRAAALAKEQAESEGLPPEEAARRQAQVNIAFKGAQKAYGSVATTGAQKDQVAIEMGKLGNQLEDASKSVARKGWVDLNALTNYAASHTDNPEYGKLDVAVQGFKTAYSAALVRGGQATDSARAHADALFSGARNHEDLMARVKQAQKEIGAVLESTSETKANVLAGVGGGTSTPTRAAPPLPGAPGPKVQKWGRDAQGNPVQLP